MTKPMVSERAVTKQLMALRHKFMSGKKKRKKEKTKHSVHVRFVSISVTYKGPSMCAMNGAKRHTRREQQLPSMPPETASSLLQPRMLHAGIRPSRAIKPSHARKGPTFLS